MVGPDQTALLVVSSPQRSIKALPRPRRNVRFFLPIPPLSADLDLAENSSRTSMVATLFAMSPDSHVLELRSYKRWTQEIHVLEGNLAMEGGNPFRSRRERGRALALADRDLAPANHNSLICHVCIRTSHHLSIAMSAVFLDANALLPCRTSSSLLRLQQLMVRLAHRARMPRRAGHPPRHSQDLTTKVSSLNMTRLVASGEESTARPVAITCLGAAYSLGEIDVF